MNKIGRTPSASIKHKQKRIYFEGGNLLVDFDANGTLGDVPNATGAAMVELVGHALVNGAVNLHVDVIPNLVGPQIGRERDVTLLPEWASEQIPCPRSKPVTRRHCAQFSVFAIATLPLDTQCYVLLCPFYIGPQKGLYFYRLGFPVSVSLLTV